MVNQSNMMLKAMKNTQTDLGVGSATGGLPFVTLSRSGFMVSNHNGGTSASSIE
jgi:hypothetical protein